MFKKIKTLDQEAAEYIAEPLGIINIPGWGRGLLLKYERWMDLERQLHRFTLAHKRQTVENALLNLRSWRQMAIAIRGLHRAGYIHRDIKPANFLIAENEKKELVMKLTDFGIARRGTQSLESMAGTLSHMPKDLVKGKASNKQHDLYSLRITFLEMLMGESIWKWKIRDRNVLQYEILGGNHDPEGTPFLEKAGTYPVIVGIPEESRKNSRKSILKVLNLGYRQTNIETYIKVINEEIKKLEKSSGK